MKRTRQILLLLPLLWAAGCQKDASETGSNYTAGVEVPVNIHAFLTDPTNKTKAIVYGQYEGNSIPDGFDYGIFVCESETKDKPHKPNSWNLRASYTASQEEEGAGSWSYQYVYNISNGALSSNQYPNITITAKENEDKTDDIYADIYAYAPYMQEAYKNGPTAIPISIAKKLSDQVDLMYAVENTDPNHFNKGLNPVGNEPLEAEFHFKHALALLVFEFKIKNYPQLYQFNSIKIEKIHPGNNSTAKLYDRATFNATEGKFNEDNYHEVDQFEMILGLSFYATTNDSDYTTQMALIPTEIEDDELQIVFKLSNHEVKPFILKKQYLTHDDGETVGFKSGYKYTFRFTLDNYLTLEDFSFGEWIEGEPLKDVEI